MFGTAAPSGELPGARRHDAAVRRPSRGARRGLPALARPRRRHRDRRVRARRRSGSGARSSRAPRTTSSCSASRPSRPGAVELGIALLPPLRRLRADRGTRPRGRRRRRRARVRVPSRAHASRGRRHRRAARRPHLRSGSRRGHDPRRRGDRLPPRRPRAGVPRHARRRGRAVLTTELRARHVESHRPPMRRVRLRLGRPAGRRARGAARRTCASNASRQAALDPGLVALHFQFGRYLLLGSSRPGTLPANLQGIWNDSYQPAWDSKFTININLQMNYWPAEVANLAECHEPLFDLIDRLARHRCARRRDVHYGCRGFVAHHNTDLWADTAPLDNVFCGLWPAGAAWLAHHLWEQLRLRPRRGVPPRARLPGDEGGGPLRARLPGRGPRDAASSCSGPRSRPRPSTSTRTASARALCMSPAGDTQIIARALRPLRRGRGDPRASTRTSAPSSRGSAQRLPAMRVGARGAAPGVARGPRRVGAGPPPRLPSLRRLPRRSDHAAPHAGARTRRTPGARAPHRRGFRPARSAAGASPGSRCSGRASTKAQHAHEQLYAILRKSTESEPARPLAPGRHEPAHRLPDRRQPRRSRGGVRDARAVARRHRAAACAAARVAVRARVAGLRLRGGFEADLEWADGRARGRAALRSVRRRPLRSSGRTIPLADQPRRSTRRGRAPRRSSSDSTPQWARSTTSAPAADRPDRRGDDGEAVLARRVPRRDDPDAP